MQACLPVNVHVHYFLHARAPHLDIQVCLKRKKISTELGGHTGQYEESYGSYHSTGLMMFLI